MAPKPSTPLSSMDDYDSLRQRVLILPLPRFYKSQKIFSQSRCLLFATLPPEIRQLIWIKCLGGLQVPLSFSDRNRRDKLPFHMGLAGLGGLCYLHCCIQDVKAYAERGLIHILLTCQRVYSEAISIVYTHNTFYFPNPSGLLNLPKLLIPVHLNTIRLLNITMPLDKKCLLLVERLPNHVRDHVRTLWASQWTNVASMEGLCELRVCMTVALCWRSDWIREQILILEPLRVITRPKVFLLTLPFRDGFENESALQELYLPCQIGRACRTDDG